MFKRQFQIAAAKDLEGWTMCNSGLRSLLAFVFVICLLMALAWIAPPPTHAQYEELVSRIKPAVVLVSVKHVLGQTGRGSGFLYDSSGFILTNHHVIEGAVDITATLPDQRIFQATVIDYTHREDYVGTELQTIADAAILKINAANLPSLPFGDSDTLRQGQELLVLGYPGSVSTNEVSVTRGIVSALRPGWVQTDAAIELGNSGGPVVDREGRVIGLATFITGPSRKIGGVVAMNRIHPLASSALNDAAPRTREVRVTGMEYVASFKVGRRVFRETYDPGTIRAGNLGQPYTRDVSVETLQVDNYNGALLARTRDSQGVDSRIYMDSEGLLTIPVSQGGWVSSSELISILPFPPFVGRTWQDRRIDQNVPQGRVVQSTTTARIESLNEVVSVPTGTYSQTMKVVTTTLQVDTRGSQQQVWHLTVTEWRAPLVGLIRSLREVSESRQRWVGELVSMTP